MLIVLSAVVYVQALYFISINLNVSAVQCQIQLTQCDAGGFSISLHQLVEEAGPSWA